MSQAKIKQQIKDKFGSLSKFCRLAQVDRYELNAVLTAKNPDVPRLRALSAAIRLMPKNTRDPKELSKSFITGVADHVNWHGGMSKFLATYPEFKGKASSIYAITQGRYKRVTPFIKQLAQTLNIEI